MASVGRRPPRQTEAGPIESVDLVIVGESEAMQEEHPFGSIQWTTDLLS